MSAPWRTTVLVAALGGQGGGVLTDWIVEAARAEGFVAQATSTPGVSQRTGETTYYVEIAARPLAGDAPVLGLSPLPGRVDVLVCAELLEAARMLERGFCTPERTTVVASTHRVYTTREKMSAGDGRYDSERMVAALQKLSARAVLFDMDALRARHGTAISAVLFGALAGSGALPLGRVSCQQAIAAAGRGITPSLRAFDEAFAVAAQNAKAPFSPPTIFTTNAGDTGDAGQAETPSVPVPAALAARVDALPSRVREFAGVGVVELADYQNVAYAQRYLDHVERVVAADAAPHEIAREAARFLALWMRYDDLIRVASRKGRRARFAGIREEAGAGAQDVVRVYDFFKPSAVEFAAILPRPLGGWLEARALSKRASSRPRSARRGGVTLQASSVSGALVLRILAALRPLRPHSLRFARERQAIAIWLESVVDALRAGQREAALDLARLPRLIRGYGDTHASGRASFERILAAWREASPRDPAQAAFALREDAQAAFNGTGCAPSRPPAAPAARSGAASSRA